MNKRNLLRYALLTVCISVLFSGCISFRSDIDGAFKAKSVTKKQLPPVSVFFHFSHLEQQLGYDAVSKIAYPYHSFRDLFGESIKEFTNIKSFNDFTDEANDIVSVRRRKMLDSLKSAYDYTIHLTVKKENSFAKHFFGYIVSTGTLEVLPYAYSWDYIITADVSNQAGKIIQSYTRRSQLVTWNQALLLFLYPFYTSEITTEEIYFESMKDIFRQIENEGVLSM